MDICAHLLENIVWRYRMVTLLQLTMDFSDYFSFFCCLTFSFHIWMDLCIGLVTIRPVHVLGPNQLNPCFESVCWFQVQNWILGSRLGFKWFGTNQTGQPIFGLECWTLKEKKKILWSLETRKHQQVVQRVACEVPSWMWNKSFVW